MNAEDQKQEWRGQGDGEPKAGDSRRPEQAPATAPEGESGDNTARPKELGGRKGPEPTRFGDWEKNGRCIDF